MHWFKSAILEKLPKWHFWTCAWNLKFFWPKVFFWSIMKVPFRKNIHNMPQGLPNPGFMQGKVQKGDFLKKPSWELNFFCCFRLPWISRRPGTLNWKWLVFLLSKILYKKCVIRMQQKNNCAVYMISMKRVQVMWKSQENQWVSSHLSLC